MKLRVVLFGKRCPVALQVIDAIEAAGHSLAGVVESGTKDAPPESAGKAWLKQRLGRLTLRGRAQQSGAAYFHLTSANKPELLPFLRSVDAEAGAIATMAQLLPQEAIDLLPAGVLNLHPSLLPKFRGPCPLFWHYYAMEMTGGVSIHFIDAGEDTGDIVAQKEVPITLGMDPFLLRDHVDAIGAKMMARALTELGNGRIERTQQSHLPCPLRARKIQPGENLIDWSWPLERVFHVLVGRRSLGPVPHIVTGYQRGSASGPSGALMNGFLAHHEGRILVAM